MLDQKDIERVIEAVLLAAAEPVSIDRLVTLFQPGELPEGDPRQAVRSALGDIEYALDGHGYELKRVASGYRFQVRQRLSPWVGRLWQEKPPRYSRALLETLALIAYRQPATRGDVEAVRGVSVGQNIMRSLLERGWIRVVGRRDVPGRPALYATTRAFLDYFNLKSLDELPPLAEIKTLVDPHVEAEADGAPAPPAPGDADPATAPPGPSATAPAAGGASAPDAGAQAEPATPPPRDAPADERPLAEVVPLRSTDRQ